MGEAPARSVQHISPWAQTAACSMQLLDCRLYLLSFVPQLLFIMLPSKSSLHCRTAGTVLDSVLSILPCVCLPACVSCLAASGWPR
jgi:hypothetical protein